MFEQSYDYILKTIICSMNILTVRLHVFLLFDMVVGFKSKQNKNGIELKYFKDISNKGIPIYNRGGVKDVKHELIK